MKRINLTALIALGLALVALDALVTVASAKDVTVSLTAPTQNTDGSVIPATGSDALASFRVEYGTCSTTSPATFGSKIGESTFASTSLSKTLTNFSAGTYCFRAYAKNAGGVESAPSTVALATIAPSTPGAPGLSVSVPVAYEYRPDGTMARVGFVQPGTVCATQSQTIKGVKYNKVDPVKVDLINWPANLKTPTNTYALCTQRVQL